MKTIKNIILIEDKEITALFNKAINDAREILQKTINNRKEKEQKELELIEHYRF